ncbi:hypothetical protein [Streptomyces sp. NPDC054887]
MPAMCHVPRAVRSSGLLTVLLVLAAVLAVMAGEGGQARPPAVVLTGEAAPAGSGTSPGSGGEGQPSDAGDSEVRGAGESARAARRGRARSRGRGLAAGPVASYRRGRRPDTRRACRVAGVPAASGERRRVVLRC